MAIKALVGLGNAGKEYEHTYHNIGAWSLLYFQRLAEKDGVVSTLLFKGPTGFMNESGIAIKTWLSYNNLSFTEILVIHDDSDLEVGTYKLVRDGGSAGHKGIENIVAHIGSKEFWRLRIGIRSLKEPVRKKALEFALSRFPLSEEPVFEEILKTGSKAVAKRVPEVIYSVNPGLKKEFIFAYLQGDGSNIITEHKGFRPEVCISSNKILNNFLLCRIKDRIFLLKNEIRKLMFSFTYSFKAHYLKGL